MANRTFTELYNEAKRYTNKKTLLASFTFLIAVALSVLSSIPNFIVDPSQLTSQHFITKTIMTVLIGTTSLVCFILIGQNVNALNENSDIWKARQSFANTAEEISKNQYARFEQWIIRKRRPAKQKEKDLNLLRHVGITNPAYLEVSLEDLEHLLERGTLELRKINKEQYDVLKAIKLGKTSIKFIQVNDYLVEHTSGVDKTDEELLNSQYMKRNLMFCERISSKALISIVIGIVLGCIGWQTLETIVEPVEGEVDPAVVKTFTIIWDSLSKIFTAITGALLGYLDGAKFNDFDARYLNLKTNIHNQFLNDTDFVAKTEKELAREEFIAQTKKDNEAEARRLGIWNGDNVNEMAIIPETKN